MDTFIAPGPAAPGSTAWDWLLDHKYLPRRLMTALAAAILIVVFDKVFYLLPRESALYPYFYALHKLNPDQIFSVGLDLLAFFMIVLICLLKNKLCERGHLAHWAGLGAIFCLLAAVKVTSVTEPLVAGLRSLEHRHSPYASTIIMGLTAVGGAAMMGWVFFRFLWNLPRWLRRRVLFSGGIFILGAIGMEGLSELVWSRYGTVSIPYTIVDILEHCFEFLGMALFIMALADYLRLLAVSSATLPAGRLCHGAPTRPSS